MIRSGRSLRVFEEKLTSIVETTIDILDIGTSQRFAKELKPYEYLFQGRNYIAAGYQPTLMYGVYNCDEHQDIQAMTFADDSFDAVLCLEVLEHVYEPHKAASEITRVLRPGGGLILTVPFLTQYHGKGGGSASHSEYPDYWRFTHHGLQSLFKHFTELEVIPLDGPIEFRLKQLYLTNFVDLPFVRPIVDALDRPRPGKATSRHLLVGRK